MLSLCLVLGLAAAAMASGTHMTYQGTYSGKCGNDGFYFNDGRAFTICSNGNAYRQACAPGSRNSPAGNYKVGYGYSTTSFCDVNLVDDGYTIRHGGYGKHSASYGGNPGGYGTNFGYGTGYGTNFGYGTGYGTNFGYGTGYGTGYGGPGYQSGYSSGYGTGYGSSYGGHRGGYGQPANPKGIGAGKGFVGGYPAGH